MKRNEMLEKIIEILWNTDYLDIPCSLTSSFDKAAEEILLKIEEHMQPKQYINPKALKDDIIDPKGEAWSYMRFNDKYPDHHFTHKNKRPYEFYLEGWEPEDE